MSIGARMCAVKLCSGELAEKLATAPMRCFGTLAFVSVHGQTRPAIVGGGTCTAILTCGIAVVLERPSRAAHSDCSLSRTLYRGVGAGLVPLFEDRGRRIPQCRLTQIDH